jgi:hypothetical protein
MIKILKKFDFFFFKHFFFFLPKKMGKFWNLSFPGVNLNNFSILLAKFITLQI